MQNSASMRSSDAERDRAADALGDHLAAGRLTFEEFEQRLDLVLRAPTHGQLRRALTDLPGSPPPELGVASARERAVHRARWDQNRWSRFVGVNAGCWALWALAGGADAHEARALWPLLITVPWGLLLARKQTRPTPKLAGTPGAQLQTPTN